MDVEQRGVAQFLDERLLVGARRSHSRVKRLCVGHHERVASVGRSRAGGELQLIKAN
jgi:hypothetical protein